MTARSLHALFTPGGLLRDSDQDGIADGVAVSFDLSDDLASCAGAIDLAARLGLESTGLSLPLVGGQGDVVVRVGPDLRLPEGLSLPEAGSGMITFAPDGALLVTGRDGAGVVAAARYLAGRYPYLQQVGDEQDVVPPEATALLVGQHGVDAVYQGGTWRRQSYVAVLVESSESPGEAAPLTSVDQLFVEREALRISLRPGLSLAERYALVDLAARLGVETAALSFPVALLPGEEAGASPRIEVGSGAEEPGITLTAVGLRVVGAPAITYLASSTDLPDWKRRLFSPAAPGAEAVHAELAYQGEWEVDRVRRIWREQVAPALAPGRPVSVDLRISEPLAIRQDLKAELNANLPVGSDVHVRSCFKQGLHWIIEEVVPALRGAGPVATVQLQFRRFTGKAPASESMLEMPIRWLQECYPADSILARELGIAASAVTFVMVEEGPTYTLTTHAANGDVLSSFSYEAQTGLRRYLDAYPERGWVHPPTGSLVVDGRSFGAIPTDLEQFWDWYQGEVLPTLRELVCSQHGEAPDPAAQPLFGTLRLAVKLSEEDRRLDVREEQVSPLDALHEDLYFVTLDYMATWGRSLNGVPFGAPGTILPFISRGDGAAPEAKVTLTRKAPVVSAPAVAPIIGLKIGSDGQVTAILLGDGRAVASPPAAMAAVDEAEPVTSISLHDVIGPEQLPSHLAYLRTLAGVRVWEAGISYLGRPCYAIEARLPVAEQIMPPAKASAMKPMLLINARHHANEVSSTNAVLKLVERIGLGEEELTRLLGRVNLVINPLENMDGAATHYAMMVEHPTWKLHAARFNAVGLEFYGQYVDPQTPYLEARVLQDLFGQYRPDILLDDHGVPSHEWLQPFAGYSSAPYFRISYWLPNALIYGIFRALDPEQYPHQVAATEGLRAELTARVRQSPEIFEGNQQWLATYKKWGVNWLPERFPLELHDQMICYTWPASPHAFSVRFPQTCVVDWVTEVPDETAQGDHLRLTAEAHLAAHVASLQFLARHPQPLASHARCERGRIRWQVGRQRPFVTGSVGREDHHAAR